MRVIGRRPGSLAALQNAVYHGAHPPEKYAAQRRKEAESKQANPKDKKHPDPKQEKKPWKKQNMDKQRKTVTEKKNTGNQQCQNEEGKIRKRRKRLNREVLKTANNVERTERGIRGANEKLLNGKRKIQRTEKRSQEGTMRLFKTIQTRTSIYP